MSKQITHIKFSKGDRVAAVSSFPLYVGKIGVIVESYPEYGFSRVAWNGDKELINCNNVGLILVKDEKQVTPVINIGSYVRDKYDIKGKIYKVCGGDVKKKTWQLEPILGARSREDFKIVPWKSVELVELKQDEW